ncbi:hypothetical protein L1049_023251 [Liquidambar formosana]|uniref:Protein Iojap, chloroplastic n=1 Tax=Liquidambar formosana TaxID=63359 RepID=A0AAP0RFF0_LIQFO
MEVSSSTLLSHPFPCPPFAEIHTRTRFSPELRLRGPRKVSGSCLHGPHHRPQKANRKLVPIAVLSSRDSSSMFSPKALGPNTSEDTDDMFDDLFEKYGKVVFRRNDQKPPSAEADDDAESLSFAVEMAKVASEVKAADIRVLFVKPLVYWTRFFIITTAFSRPQIDAIGSRIRDLAEKQYGKIPSGDSKPNSWTLLDFGDVVVHIFLPQQRAYYNLEEFYEAECYLVGNCQACSACSR